MTEEISRLNLKIQQRYLDLIIEQAEQLKAFPDIDNHEAIMKVLRDIRKIGGVKRKWELKI